MSGSQRLQLGSRVNASPAGNEVITAAPRPQQNPPGQRPPVVRFEFSDRDISELTALALHFSLRGRRHNSELTNDLACRVQVALMHHGDAHPEQFTFTDFGRLMGWTAYAAEVSPALRLAVRDLARRIWCGLSGDATCPMFAAEGR